MKPAPRRSRPDTHGLGALALAVLQLIAFAALPTADALLDIEEFELPLHVESEGSLACAPPHDHLFCQAVRSLAAGGTTPVIGGAEPPPAPILGLEAQSTGDVAARRILTRSIGSRAPPLA
jgi:hypothetical protein